MTPKTHLSDIVLTLKSDTSKVFYPELVPSSAAAELLHAVVDNAKVVDVAKKALFYGKEDPELGPLLKLFNLIDENAYHPDGRDLLHAIMGIAGETGEVIETVLDVSDEGTMDGDKLADELGDLLWYIQLACAYLHTDMEAILERNAAKLKARYGDNFSQEKAVTRDVQNEDIATRTM